jgi:hypothetical protein
MQAPRQIVTPFRPIPLDVPDGMKPNEFFNSTENLNDLIHNNGLLVTPENLLMYRKALGHSNVFDTSIIYNTSQTILNPLGRPVRRTQLPENVKNVWNRMNQIIIEYMLEQVPDPALLGNTGRHRRPEKTPVLERIRPHPQRLHRLLSRLLHPGLIQKRPHSKRRLLPRTRRIRTALQQLLPQSRQKSPRPLHHRRQIRQLHPLATRVQTAHLPQRRRQAHRHHKPELHRQRHHRVTGRRRQARTECRRV